ncbi:MAG: hypothetical protein Ct9H300mP28_18680 [Pseudomonadota bacterium]|nr:MAG: hypothetical protein Ct9H300mP28_18680 [Pseudomonadota bacterium]
MSVTGEPDGSPMKVGVGIADVSAECTPLSAFLLLFATVKGRKGATHRPCPAGFSSGMAD